MTIKPTPVEFNLDYEKFIFNKETAIKFEQALSNPDLWKFALHDDISYSAEESLQWSWIETAVDGFTIWTDSKVKTYFLFYHKKKTWITVCFNGLPFIREDINNSTIYQRATEIVKHIRLSNELIKFKEANEKLKKINTEISNGISS